MFVGKWKKKITIVKVWKTHLFAVVENSFYAFHFLCEQEKSIRSLGILIELVADMMKFSWMEAQQFYTWHDL